MKRALLASLILGAGAIGLESLHRTTARLHATQAPIEAEWQAVTNRLAELDEAVTALRDEVEDRKSRLKQMQPGGGVDRRLLRLLEGRALSSDDWVQLRQELGIGWNNSKDYVLVSKRVMEQIGLQTLEGSGNVTPAARAVLAITPEEEARIRVALKSIGDEYPAWIRTHAQRIGPAGGVVAQYTIPTNPELALSLSNRVVNAVAATLGDERANLLLSKARSWDGWQRAGVGEADATLTLRRLATNGESRLAWEWKKGASVSSAEVAYGYYPSSSFGWLFPGGWEDLARREGFDLPASFRKPPKQ
jgi:hypothetical protein